LRDLIRSEEAGRRRLDVDDAAVCDDLDTPADLAALRPGTVPSFGSSRRAQSVGDAFANGAD
jgi:hypothetical protein